MQESNKIKVLLIGAGGREHALMWSFIKSSLLEKLYITEEKHGISTEIVEIIQLDIDKPLLVSLFCKEKSIDLVVIGPEKYLAEGLADTLLAEGILVFGPNKTATQLESSKSFTKDICKMNGIPTAKHALFSDANSAKDYIRTRGLPAVIKADGLAQGKGVVICKTLEEADQTIDEMLAGKFGIASSTIIIEEFLEGTEISFFALFDGENVLPLGSAKDHKAITYKGRSYNTGGMGAYSPVDNIPNMDNVIMRKIIYPTVSSLSSMGITFKGVLFAGLIITNEGPKLLEYNVRFGDPEIQSIVPRLASDLLQLIFKTAQGKLNNEIVKWHDKHSVCVVIATRGYPLDYTNGSEIKGLEKLATLKDVIVFYAATKLQNGKLIANGGRVLNIVGTGNNLAEARERAYSAVRMIEWPEGIYVESIGAS